MRDDGWVETKDAAAMTSSRGRPRVQEAADTIVAGVLASAGPRVSTPAYTTRRVAELTGLSQTLVSRAGRRIRSGAQHSPTAGAGAASGASDNGDDDGATLQLVRFSVEYPVITVGFGPVSGDGGGSGGDPLRPQAFHRRAAAVMAALQVSGAADWAPTEAGLPPSERADHPLSRTRLPPRPRRGERAETTGTPLNSVGVPVVSAHQPPSGAAPGALELQWRPGPSTWPEFLASVAAMLDRCRPSIDSVPADLLRQLAAGAGRGLHGVAWTRGRASPSFSPDSDSKFPRLAEYPAPGIGSPDHRGPRLPLSATEQIAVALRREMISSGFRAGDRLSVTMLAQRLGLGHARVRNAMRQLADDGLLMHSEGGFRIPHVTGTDVIDLYASRLHVGMVILRACAARPRQRLLPVRLALGSLEAVAAQGSLADAGEADLRFQQELAEASGLRQSAHSFHGLTLRLRMFISVLQLDYAPAAERLVAENRRLLAAVLEGRAEESVRIWRSKLDDAVRHMSASAPDTFDPRLWSQLTP